ncbi:hypothetical protein K7432_014018 [Basidiobolus ranarum]|uniref:N-acetyltransferase domain-containing protein n=1 Tax=Basidiobolus ranarum TaxID=34480 RepID=A0ABR2VQ04_9FUNG
MTSSNIHLSRYNNAVDFLNIVYSFLSEAPYTNGYILGSLADENNEFTVIFDSKKCPILAVMTQPSKTFILSHSTSWTTEALEVLISDIKLNNLPITGIRGPENVTTEFSQIFERVFQKSMVPGEPSRIYKCTSVIPTPNLPQNGVKRLAQAENLDLISHWLEEFFVECQVHVSEDPKPIAKESIESNSMYFWENSLGEIVSMAAFKRANEFSVNVCYVYTPKQFRGKGYAYQLVKGLTLELLEKYPAVVLNAFTSNEISQGVYKKIGFTKVIETMDYRNF